MYSNIIPGSQGSTREICGARRIACRSFYASEYETQVCYLLSRAAISMMHRRRYRPERLPFHRDKCEIIHSLPFSHGSLLKLRPGYTLYEGKSLFIKRPSTWYQLVALPAPSLWSASYSILMYLSFENVFRASLTRKMTLQKGTNFPGQITNCDIKVWKININWHNTNSRLFITRACPLPLSQNTIRIIIYRSSQTIFSNKSFYV